MVATCTKGDGNYFWAKAPRTLHIDAQEADAAVVVELVATAKQLIPEQALAILLPMPPARSQANRCRRYVHGWGCATTVRFDPFVSRLSQFKVDKRLAKIEPVGNLLSAVYFDVDGGKEIDHSDGSPYGLVVLAYPPGEDPEHAADGWRNSRQQSWTSLRISTSTKPQAIGTGLH